MSAGGAWKHPQSDQEERVWHLAKKKSKVFGGHPTFKKLQQHLNKKPAYQDLVWYYDLGKLVNNVCPIKDRGYGQNKIRTLAEELACGSKHLEQDLLYSRKVCAVMTKKEVTHLQGKGTMDYRLSRSHLMPLSSLDDKVTRAETAAKCISEQWTVPILMQEVRSIRGKRSSGGAPLAKPASPEAALAEMIDRAEDWLKRCKKVWLGADGVLAKPISRTTATKLSKQLEAAQQTLTDLRDTADDARRKLERQRKQATTKKTSKK